MFVRQLCLFLFVSSSLYKTSCGCMQLAQKRGDECAARLEQQEKELLQSTEEFKLKMEDLRHKTEEQIKAVLKETRYPPKKRGTLLTIGRT